MPKNQGFYGFAVTNKTLVKDSAQASDQSICAVQFTMISVLQYLQYAGNSFNSVFFFTFIILGFPHNGHSPHPFFTHILFFDLLLAFIHIPRLLRKRPAAHSQQDAFFY